MVYFCDPRPRAAPPLPAYGTMCALPIVRKKSTPPTGQDGAPMEVPRENGDGGRDEYPGHHVIVDSCCIDRFEE